MDPTLPASSILIWPPCISSLQYKRASARDPLFVGPEPTAARDQAHQQNSGQVQGGEEKFTVHSSDSEGDGYGKWGSSSSSSSSSSGSDHNDDDLTLVQGDDDAGGDDDDDDESGVIAAQSGVEAERVGDRLEREALERAMAASSVIGQ